MTNCLYKVSTVDWGYCRDATALLAHLKPSASVPTILHYGAGPARCDDLPRFRVIHIERRGREYYGYVNLYNARG